MNHVFTSMSSEKLAKIILTANKRIVLAVPSLRNIVADRLINVVSKIGKDRITIVIDCDEEVFRLGYGDFQAVQVIREAEISVRQCSGLRVGILVVDDCAWIFTPTALYVQNEVHSDETPNAIQLEGDDINRLIESVVSDEAKSSTLVKGRIEIGNQIVSTGEIQKTKDALKTAPPVAFDVARQVRVFQPYIQYVDLHLNGCSIERKIVKIPNDIFNPELSAELEQRLKTQFNLIGKSSTLSSKQLQSKLDEIRKTYMKPLGKKWGNVMLRSKRCQFDKEIEDFKKEIAKHQQKVENKLQNEIDKSKKQIVDAFWKSIIDNPPRDLLGQIMEAKPSKENAKEWLSHKLDGCFPKAENILKEMELECQFKDVTYETLNEKGFSESLRKAYPFVDWDKPFDEFNAAKERES